MIPVVCFTCGRPLGNKERPYQDRLQIMSSKEALDDLGLKRECCRATMLTYVDTAESTLDFEHANALKAPDDTPKDYVRVRTAVAVRPPRPKRKHRSSHDGGGDGGGNDREEEDDGNARRVRPRFINEDDADSSDRDDSDREGGLDGGDDDDGNRSCDVGVGQHCRRGCPCCPRLDAATLAEQRRRRRIILAR